MVKFRINKFTLYNGKELFYVERERRFLFFKKWKICRLSNGFCDDSELDTKEAIVKYNTVYTVPTLQMARYYVDNTTALIGTGGNVLEMYTTGKKVEKRNE